MGQTTGEKLAAKIVELIDAKVLAERERNNRALNRMVVRQNEAAALACEISILFDAQKTANKQSPSGQKVLS